MSPSGLLVRSASGNGRGLCPSRWRSAPSSPESDSDVLRRDWLAGSILIYSEAAMRVVVFPTGGSGMGRA
jgi:hypothetical protein